MKGKIASIIAFDGPDGVGKTTQIELYASYLKNEGKKVYVTRNAGGTPIGELLRTASLSDNTRPAITDLYISLAMGEALAEDLAFKCKKFDVILIDRSPLALVAYNTYGSQLKEERLGLSACAHLMRVYGLTTLVYFSAPQKVLDNRIKKRTDKPVDYYEKQGKEYNQRVRLGYEKGLKHVKETVSSVNVIDIDAAKDIKTIQKNLQAKLKST